MCVGSSSQGRAEVLKCEAQSKLKIPPICCFAVPEQPGERGAAQIHFTDLALKNPSNHEGKVRTFEEKAAKLGFYFPHAF